MLLSASQWSILSSLVVVGAEVASMRFAAAAAALGAIAQVT
jgi:hypothetical protein